MNQRQAAAEYRARVKQIPLDAEADRQRSVSAAIEAATNRAITMANERRREEEDGVVWLGHCEVVERTRKVGT